VKPNVSIAPTARLLAGLNVVELSQGIAGPFCGKLLADLGADVIKVEPPEGDRTRFAGPFPGDEPDPEKSGLFLALNTSKRSLILDVADAAGRARLRELLSTADVLIWGDGATGAKDDAMPVEELKRLIPRLVMTSVTPFGRSGPYAERKSSDLVIFQMSGYAPLVPGGVDDLDASPPLRAGGQQSEFVTGISAATGTLMALALRDRNGTAGLLDVSAWESMAMMPQSTFVDAALGKAPRSRLRGAEARAAVVAILPTTDGFIAISPREDHQWAAWLEIMDHPSWEDDERFNTRQGRQKNWEQLEPLIVEWTKQRGKQELYHACQEAHVPAFPVNTAADLLTSTQMLARGFFEELEHPVAGKLPYAGFPIKVSGGELRIETPAPLLGEHTDATFGPSAPNRSALSRFASPSAATLPGKQPERGEGQPDAKDGAWASSKSNAASSSPERGEGALPLEGVRVLDFSWIIAGPTCTRILGLMGADVIKIESRRRPDPTRNSSTQCFLNQSKRSLSLNLSTDRGLALAKELGAHCDVVIENYATGVIERMGLGYDVLKAVNPRLVMLSSSGLGHTGPDRNHVAYGTLMQCFTGWSGQTGYPGGQPMIGGVWGDPLTGMLQTFFVLSALRQRDRTGKGMYVDLSMAEAMCTLLPESFMEYAMNGRIVTPQGNRDRRYAPHNLYRCAGHDAWASIAVTGDDEWLALCQAMDRIDFAKDARFATASGRLAHAGELDAAIGAWTASQTPQHVVERLQPFVPSGVSLNAANAFTDPHLRQRGFFIESTGNSGEPVLLPGVPWHLDGVTPRAFAAQELGAGNGAVLRELLGLSDLEVATLEAEGILH
jgi:crotonobetainyl-CoA:carnitine CoA-transferase CaiB-like acyl-CoA transferase